MRIFASKTVFLMSKKRIFTLSDALPFGGGKSATNRRKRRTDVTRNVELLQRCNQAWMNLENMRKTRQRVLNYVFGDQWGDIVEYKNGRYTEREFMRRRGSVPLTNNIMISIYNSLTGLYAKQGTEPLAFARTRDAQWLSDMMSATLQANWQDTNMADLLSTCFGEYLCGGVAVARETFEERDQVLDSYTDTYNPNYVFWEGGNDVRHTDLDLIGVLHDISSEELVFRFSRLGFTRDELMDIFSQQPACGYNESTYLQQNDKNNLDYVSFSNAAELGKSRVIEVWTRCIKERYQCYDPIAQSAGNALFRCELNDIDGVKETNRQRKKLYDEEGIEEEQRAYISFERIQDLYWKYTYMAPDGTVLCEDETPYDFKKHPFSIKLYPFVNGEIHPLMGNIIDQNRFINRLIVMHDMAVRSAAKGITLVPNENVPDNMTPQDFADEFTSYDGIIFYDTNRINPNLRPEVITSNATQIGTTELLQMEINLIQQISNVSGALQGKTPSAGTSASRYAMETQNSTVALYKVLQDFTTFAENIARKKCYNIKQYYEDGRLINNQNNDGVFVYDRMATRDVMFKISVKEAAATVAHQMQANDTMLQLLQMGAINVVQYLQNVNLPFADSLLRSIQSQQMQQEAIAQLQQQVQEQGGANQQQVANAENMLNQTA